MSPDEIRAAAEVYHELGPDYQATVIDTFLDRISKEIDARVDARLAQLQPAQPVRPVRNQASLALPIVSMALGIPLTVIGLGISGAPVTVLIWIVIGVLNVAYALSSRP